MWISLIRTHGKSGNTTVLKHFASENGHGNSAFFTSGHAFHLRHIGCEQEKSRAESAHDKKHVVHTKENTE